MSGKQAAVQPLQMEPAPVGRVLQRQCACGQHTVAGECADCRRKWEVGTLQRTSLQPPKGPPIVHEMPHSPSQPLDLATRAFMKPHFGHDFLRVRMHTDGRANWVPQLRVDREVSKPMADEQFG
jgi:hypothetical protein